jgi:hypothetical protein
MVLSFRLQNNLEKVEYESPQAAPAKLTLLTDSSPLKPLATPAFHKLQYRSKSSNAPLAKRYSESNEHCAIVAY